MSSHGFEPVNTPCPAGAKIESNVLFKNTRVLADKLMPRWTVQECERCEPK